MINPRVFSDKDLGSLAEQLYSKDASQLRELAIALYDRGKELVSVDDSLAERVANLLRQGKKVSKSDFERLQSTAEEADIRYLDVLDSEGAASNRCLEEFSKARLLMALCFAARNTKVFFIESIYESFIASNRSKSFIEIIKQYIIKESVPPAR